MDWSLNTAVEHCRTHPKPVVEADDDDVTVEGEVMAWIHIARTDVPRSSIDPHDHWLQAVTEMVFARCL